MDAYDEISSVVLGFGAAIKQVAIWVVCIFAIVVIAVGLLLSGSG